MDMEEKSILLDSTLYRVGRKILDLDNKISIASRDSALYIIPRHNLLRQFKQ